MLVVRLVGSWDSLHVKPVNTDSRGRKKAKRCVAHHDQLGSHLIPGVV
jgi:hypothetical protein